MNRNLRALVLCLLCLVVPIASLTQTPPSGWITLTASNIQEPTGPGGALQPVSNANLCVLPVDTSNRPLAVRAGGSGGVLISTPTCTAISSGAITPMFVPDTSQTVPQNPCLRFTIVSSTGLPLLPPTGFNCGQPSSVDGIGTEANIWCSTSSGVTTCNFDLFPPNVASQAVIQYGPQGPAGSIAVNWRGAWVAHRSYAVNDAYRAIYQGNYAAFRVTNAYTSGSTFGSADTSNAAQYDAVPLLEGGSAAEANVAAGSIGSLIGGAATNEIIFSGSNVSARVAQACADASPTNIITVLIPQSETDSTAAIPANGPGEWCKIDDERGLSTFYVRAGTQSVCTPGASTCPGGPAKWGQFSMASAGSATKSIQRFLAEAVTGGNNTFGTKTNYETMDVQLRSRTPGQHINIGSLNASYSNGDVEALSQVQDCEGKPSSSGDQGCASIGLTVNAGFAPSAGTVAAKADATCQSGASNCLTLCGSSSISTGQCSAGMTSGNEIGEQNYLVNTSRNVYSTGTVSSISGTPPTVTGSGTNWMTNLCGGSPCSPPNLYFEMTGEAIGQVLSGTSSLGSVSVSGATVTGPGTVILTSFSDSCSGAQAYLTLNSSNVATALGIMEGGKQCISAGSISATCSQGTIACSGTVTFTPTFLAASGVHIIVPISSIASDTSLTLNLTAFGANQAYTGNYTSGAYAIYQGSSITAVPDVSGTLGNTNTAPFVTVQVAVADPTQFTVGDTFWDAHGEIEGAGLLNGVVNQNNMWSANPSVAVIGVNTAGSIPVSGGISVTGAFFHQPLLLDWHANFAGIAPPAGISLQGISPANGYITVTDFSNATRLKLYCPPLSTGSLTCLYFDRILGVNYWEVGTTTPSSTVYLSTDGRIGVGEAPVASIAGAFNGTVQATALQATGLPSKTIIGTDGSGNVQDASSAALTNNTSGSAASLSVAGQTGLISLTGITSTNRQKTVRDAADTFLELGGSYTPTGTWNWAASCSGCTWPTFNQNTTGTAANLSGAPALPSGTTVTTQAAGDSTGKAASDGFVATALSNASITSVNAGRVASGWCTGTATSSTTLEPFMLGTTVGSSAACTNGGIGATSPTSGPVMTQSGTISNLTMVCQTGGISSSSGALTLYYLRAGTQHASTLTLTYGTTANAVVQDTTHTLAYQAGDVIKVAFTTQGSETLASCGFSFQY